MRQVHTLEELRNLPANSIVAGSDGNLYMVIETGRAVMPRTLVVLEMRMVVDDAVAVSDGPARVLYAHDAEAVPVL